MNTRKPYKVQTWQQRDGVWRCCWAKLYSHTYPASSAYGNRTRRKPGRWVDVKEHFASRVEALRAGQALAAQTVTS